MVCTQAFEHQQRTRPIWDRHRPRLPMLSIREFIEFLNHQDRFVPLEDRPHDEEDNFGRELTITLWDWRTHEEEMRRKFDFTLRRLAGWLLRSANAYSQQDKYGAVVGVVEVWKLPDMERIPRVLRHPRIKYQVVNVKQIGQQEVLAEDA
ncbi:hypothetical protein TWF696_002505 [Orbilia brochopaga]|uniref:Uncharacterized protein n=1 Tax=Orbilia brochopaga TaxID=3140254 RepID=A0AAV9U1G2_9PEZI